MTKTKALLTLIVFALTSVSAIGQYNPDIDKKVLDNGTEGFKDAWRALKIADEYYKKDLEGEYLNALEFYLLAYEYNSYVPELNYKIGVCYLMSIKKQKALKFFRSAYVLNENVTPDIHLMLARGYHYNEQYEQAITEYNTFLNALSLDEKNKYRVRVTKYINECKNGIELSKNKARVFIDNLTDINSEFPDYSPLISADESMMVFTARRDDTFGGRRDKLDGNFYEDVYVSYNIRGKWAKPQNMGEPINTKYHDATVGLSADGQELMLYNNGDIYVSKQQGRNWTALKLLGPEVNSADNETHASVSADGRTIYFIRGKTTDQNSNGDIYVTHKMLSGRWTTPKKLPPNVNTPYDEDGVFIHPDGRTLYFSSKGHNSIGGYDVFVTRLQENNTWSNPENIGIPINTPFHDIYLVVSASGQNAYYSSFRDDSKGFSDIYKVIFLGPEKQTITNNEDNLIASIANPISETVIQSAVEIKTIRLTVVKGVVTDKATAKAVKATIELIDNKTNEVITTIESNSETGKYLVALPSGKNYAIVVSKDNYMTHSENFNIPPAQNYQEITKDIGLLDVSPGATVILKNIFFDVSKSILRPESYGELNRVKKMMLEDYPAMRLEVSGHTDNVGTKASNLRLSQQRAQAVVNYLVGQGVLESRLTHKGFGFEQPVATNNTEEGRQQNRRVEIKVLSIK